MNGQACCFYGVCCPPGSEEQIDAIVAEMAKDAERGGVKFNRGDARYYVAWLVNRATIAPKSFGKVINDLSELKAGK